MNENYDGPRTAYGEAYHGYWIKDLSKLNNRFGTADDLKALIQELHRREMWAGDLPRTSARLMHSRRYIMVDIVVNNVMSTSLKPDYSHYFSKDSVSMHFQH